MSSSPWEILHQAIVAEGELRILLEVAKLPSPMLHVIGTTDSFVCDWCRKRSAGDETVQSHTEECVRGRALAAKEGK